jgi:hypothetical protein
MSRGIVVAGMAVAIVGAALVVQAAEYGTRMTSSTCRSGSRK